MGNFFNQAVENSIRIYNNILKITIGQGYDSTTAFLLYLLYVNDHYKMITIDLSKQQALDPFPKAIQQIDFTGNLNRDRNTTMIFITEEAKETMLDFSQRTVRIF